MVMLAKSQSLAEIAAAVIVRAVPGTSLWMNILRAKELPAQVRVPLTVWFAPRLMLVKPLAEGALIVRLLKVWAPEIGIRAPAKAEVKDTL